MVNKGPRARPQTNATLTLDDVRSVVEGRETVREVAARTGLTTQAIYRYVGRWRDRLPPPEGQPGE